jgi:hypothetical protein
LSNVNEGSIIQHVPHANIGYDGNIYPIKAKGQQGGGGMGWTKSELKISKEHKTTKQTKYLAKKKEKKIHRRKT